MVTSSCHLRYPDRDAVVEALRALDPGAEAPVAIWPPRRVPAGVLISPERQGWVSFWSTLGSADELLARLSASLECAGLVFHVAGTRAWFLSVYQDGHLIAEYETPLPVVEEERLRAEAAEALEAEGIEPEREPERWDAEVERLRAEPEYRDDFAERRIAQRDTDPLLPLMRPFASPHELEVLLEPRDDDEGLFFADEAAEAFASYLGLRDVAWDPNADQEALAEGDYGDLEGFPDDFPAFLCVPLTRWFALPS